MKLKELEELFKPNKPLTLGEIPIGAKFKFVKEQKRHMSGAWYTYEYIKIKNDYNSVWAEYNNEDNCLKQIDFYSDRLVELL